MGGPGIHPEACARGRIREDITEKLEPVSVMVTELLLTFVEWDNLY